MTRADDPSLFKLLNRLSGLSDQLGLELTAVEANLADLRRNARANQGRRGGAGSADAAKYALGSALTMLGFGPDDELVLLGLWSQPDVALRWLATARLKQGQASLYEMIATITADPDRQAWCRQAGSRLRWQRMKALYDASVTSFLESGKAGPHEKWRKLPITDDQADLIATLSQLLRIEIPKLADRGSAFEWIHERGGNPRYWHAPGHPPAWKD